MKYPIEYVNEITAGLQALTSRVVVLLGRLFHSSMLASTSRILPANQGAKLIIIAV